ncbi:sortase [Candidatus Gottesmanbacteria bacterium]|nr:sortase [Candidatus Gottesmanbacteria bacterium]
MDVSLKRILTLSAVAGGIIVCIIWLVSVVLPVTLLEIGYQYKKALRDVFHVSDIRGLILPQFNLDLRGFSSIHKTNGITIPALFIDSEIVFNVDPNDEKMYKAALGKGIAHASSTAFPGSGIGLGYYFAHSSTPQFVTQYNAIFYLLDKLKTGDEIYIFHEKERTDYRVTTKEFTEPTDVSFLKKTYKKETIVLQTCWPAGTTQKRLLVFAERL